MIKYKCIRTFEPPVNISEALNRAMGDTELIQMLFDDFKLTLATHIEKINTAIDNRDMKALEKEAHQLKGSAGSMGVHGVAMIALDLERMGKGDMEIDAQAVIDLRNEIQRFLDYMDHFDWSQV